MLQNDDYYLPRRRSRERADPRPAGEARRPQGSAQRRGASQRTAAARAGQADQLDKITAPGHIQFERVFASSTPGDQFFGRIITDQDPVLFSILQISRRYTAEVYRDLKI